MRLSKIISAGLTGTTFMTLFSYLISKGKDENFKEPDLLGKLLYRLFPDMRKEHIGLAGWNLHYAVGLVFALIYSKLWKEGYIKHTIKSGLVLGGLSGLLAIMVWSLSFKLHPNPPKTSYKRYYGHLLIAHLVFGVFASIGYGLAARRKNKRTILVA